MYLPAPASAQNFQQQQPQGTAQPAAAAEDWDSLFAGIDKPTHRSSPSFPTIPSSSFPEPPAAQQAQQPQQTKAEEPEDDPILQRLTSMGYARDESLNALEQFDYDLNKAANHLATKH
ncbi:hypothetical protein KEM55_000894 [Ascosphaera atra]|nr:hypothetical protein KEM55_000894 [Ascosphaera atra]